MKTHTFKPKARLLVQLGEQLIKNEGIALLELIKNSYDADAKKVEISLSKLDSKEEGKIIVKDYGNGMDLDLVENVWLEPGTDYKTLEENKFSPHLGRRVLGQKGIGRFAAHKMGNNIELITRKKDSQEIHLNIDWTRLKQTRYLEDFPISVDVKDPEVFVGDETGTQIIISNFRKPWVKSQFRDAYRSWTSLLSPFNAPEKFNIEYNIDRDDWLEGLLTLDKLKKAALFDVECMFEGDKIQKFTYKFTPWESMTDIEGRTITVDDPHLKTLLKLKSQDDLGKLHNVDLSNFDIGPVRLHALIFNRDSKILSLGLEDKSGFKKYLNENGGIRVYRDGVRVFDYGEKGNDWLGLDEKRINSPGQKISNNIILGSVSVDADKSQSLAEKANREGFIENEAYGQFKAAISYVMETVEKLRAPDKDRLRSVYGPSRRTEPVIYSINDLSDTITIDVVETELQKKLLKKLMKIKTEYMQINDLLLKSSNTGLVFNTVVHQVEKIVKELKATVEINPVDKKLLKLVDNLEKTIRGYIFLVKKSSIKNNSLKNLINNAFDILENRLNKHEITPVKKYRDFPVEDKVDSYDGHTVTSIINILDNSIYWLDQKDGSNKKIFVSISDEMEGYLSIVIADNGTGFSNITAQQMVSPYIGTKPFGTGLGLHLAKEVMELQKGEIRFPDWGDFLLPKEFQDGAIVALCFRKKKKK